MRLGRTLLALLGLKPEQAWTQASAPYCGITPLIKFIGEWYGIDYAPNTRETIRDEAVKHFVEFGLVLRNPDDPKRPTNSGKTVYQIEPNALELIRVFNTDRWNEMLTLYHAKPEINPTRTRKTTDSCSNSTHASIRKIDHALSRRTKPVIRAIVEEFVCSAHSRGLRCVRRRRRRQVSLSKNRVSGAARC